MAHTLAGQDLGAVESEEWRKSQPLIVLDAVDGDTYNTAATSLLGVSRRIGIRGTVKFSSQANMFTFLRAIDALVKPMNATATTYYSEYYNPYPADTGNQHAAYTSVLVEEFAHTKEGGEELWAVHYDIQMIEAVGVA
jgi:hypothetical protein